MIFDELRSLCHEPGFLHAISSVLLRDFFIGVDREGTIKRDDQRRYSRSKLNNNELMLLVGLLVQSEGREVASVIGNTDVQITRADKLLEEFHQTLEQPMKEWVRSLSAPVDSNEKNKTRGGPAS